jgi:DNA-binding GntR family transcriptional regulator
MGTMHADIAEMTLAREPLPYPFLHSLPRRGRGGTMQRVQDAIRGAIVALDFTPGEFIQKDAICKRLGVSRFPVSEALGRLADEGFVEILPQRGTRVRRIDIASCRQAIFIRRAIEGEAMRMIAPSASDGLLMRLERNLTDQKLALEQGDAQSFFRIDIEFHDMLLSELGYERAKAIVETARGSLDRMRLFLLRTPERQRQSHLEHAAIMAALKSHDPDAAQQAMDRHLDMVMVEIETRAAENPRMFALVSPAG